MPSSCRISAWPASRGSIFRPCACMPPRRWRSTTSKASAPPRASGFRRVTLARELTLDEIRAIAKQAPGEIEAFLHGALCYSYSGLCLYSALLRDRSGNRGSCAYPCRDCLLPRARSRRRGWRFYKYSTSSEPAPAAWSSP